jgi:hypothetical protein
MDDCGVGVSKIKSTEYLNFELALGEMVKERNSSDVLRKFKDYMITRDMCHSFELAWRHCSPNPPIEFAEAGAIRTRMLFLQMRPDQIRKTLKLDVEEIAFLESMAGTNPQEIRHERR